jgi:hypothetical protein
VHPSCQTLGVTIALGKKKCQAGEDFAISHRSGGSLRQGATGENTKRCLSCAKSVSRRSLFRHTAAGEVNALHCSGVARIKVSPSVELVRTGGVSKQMKTKTPTCISVSGRAVAGKVAANQTTTPNPSIEGMPKRLRLLCTPHVKR